MLPLSSIQGNEYSWKVGDNYTWETNFGLTWSYENSTATWGDYFHFSTQKEEVEILEVSTVDKTLLLEVSQYHPDYEGYTKPFSVNEVDDSYDLIRSLDNKDVNSLFNFIYEYDEVENETYLNNVTIPSYTNRIPEMYFCSANWLIINSLFHTLFNDTAIIDTVNGTEITFRDFLDNCTFTIMGESDYTTAINQMIPTNHHWSAEFNYTDLLEIRSPEITSFEVEEAIATFDLRYSESGVLEKYYLRTAVVVHINNYTYRRLIIREYTLIGSNPSSNLLKKIIPATIAVVLIVTIVFLIINIMKKRKV